MVICISKLMCKKTQHTHVPMGPWNPYNCVLWEKQSGFEKIDNGH